MNDRENKYRVLGDIQMYEAVGDERRREAALSYLNRLADRGAAALLKADGIAALFALKETGDERFLKAAKAKAENGAADFWELPFYTAFDTKYQKKGHYEKIVSRFRERERFSDDELVIAADTLAQMSQEIYEYYRELADIVRREIKERLKGGEEGILSPEFAYCVLKACNLNVLQKEKYRDFGIRVWKKAEESCREDCGGMMAMLRAQYLILSKEGGLTA